MLPAFVAEMDFPLAAPVAAALHEAVDRSDTGYRFLDELPEVVSAYVAESFDWPVDPRQVTCVPDVIAGMAHAIATLTAPGDAIVVNPPVYPPFFTVVRDVANRTLVEVPMRRHADGSYDWDLDGLEQAFSRPDVTGYVMCSPHNPTGSVPSRQTLESIAALAAAHGVTVISDEIHAALVLPGSMHTPYLTVAAPDAPAVALVSATKAWNLAGLKCAQLVGSPVVADRLRDEVPPAVTFGIGHFGVLATIAAYRDGATWHADVSSVLDGNRRLLTGLLAEHLPRARYVPPQATYLAWIDLREYDLGDDPADAMLERGRVALSPGPSFGSGGAGYVRLNFATSPAILREIVGRMGVVVQ